MRNTSGTSVRGWLAFVLPALLPVAAWADPLVLEAPTEVPATATVPAQNPPADPALATGRILVFPFQADNPADANAWMGKSIQESLVADLTVVAPDRVTTTDQAAGTLDNTVALARQRGAKFVVAGGFATSAGDLRITGQILNVETGKPVGAIKVTGDPSQIFRMEDGLAMQIKAQLMPGQVPAAPQQPAQPQVQQPQQLPYPVQTPIVNDPNSVRADYPPQSTYATPPAPTIYGADSSDNYLDVPAAYPYVYPTYTYSPYCNYGGYCSVGIGLGGYYGCYNGYGYGGYGRGYGYGGYGRGYGYGGYGGSRNYNGRSGINSYSGVRSGAAIRGASSFRSAASYRSSAFSGRSSVGHASSFGGSHAGGSFHSSGGGGSFHGGGSSHGGGGGHGGGHR